MACEYSGVNIKIIPLAELCSKARELLTHYLFHFYVLFELVSITEISTGMISLTLFGENVKRKLLFGCLMTKGI